MIFEEDPPGIPLIYLVVDCAQGRHPLNGVVGVYTTRALADQAADIANRKWEGRRVVTYRPIWDVLPGELRD